jgi:hypothetical protein
MMLEKIVSPENEKFIGVYDNVFSYQETVNLFRFFRGSLYLTNGGDNQEQEGYQIFSNFSNLDLENSNIKNTKGFQTIVDKLNLGDRSVKQVRVNLSTPAEKNRVHADGFGTTFLYYANLEWQVDWGGHTLFLEEDLQEAKYVCFYKPNRVVVFDGSIPHMVMTPSSSCPVSRYSFAIQFS